MCLIIYKPAGVESPGRALLERAHFFNHDGCGLCSPNAFYKGLSFEKLATTAAKVGLDEPCLYHFRWATHGSVKRANCHPFFDPATGTFFMHNGVLGVYPKGDMTDSEFVFVRDIVPHLGAGLDSPDFAKAVCQVIGNSRFAFMQGRDVRLFGQWLESTDGLFFSNGRLFY